MNDCEDKNSTHYFMCHMTQEEFQKNNTHCVVRNFKMNLIHPERIIVIDKPWKCLSCSSGFEDREIQDNE